MSTEKMTIDELNAKLKDLDAQRKAIKMEMMKLHKAREELEEAARLDAELDKLQRKFPKQRLEAVGIPTGERMGKAGAG